MNVVLRSPEDGQLTRVCLELSGLLSGQAATGTGTTMGASAVSGAGMGPTTAPSAEAVCWRPGHPSPSIPTLPPLTGGPHPLVLGHPEHLSNEPRVPPKPSCPFWMAVGSTSIPRAPLFHAWIPFGAASLGVLRGVPMRGPGPPSGSGLPTEPAALTASFLTVAGRGTQLPVNRSTAMPGRPNFGEPLCRPWGRGTQAVQ